MGPATGQLLPAASRVRLGVWRPVGAGLVGAGPEAALRGRGGLLRPGRRLLDSCRGRGPSLGSRGVMLVTIGGVLLTLLHLAMF